MVKRRSTHHARPKGGKGGVGRGKDFFGFKRQIISGVENNTVYMAGGGVLLIGAVGLLAVSGIIPIPGMGSASTATINVYPANVKTGDLVTFEGDFRGANGQVVTLPTGYIAVFEDTGNKVYDSTLGNFVNHFKIQVNTSNYRDGSYTVVVSDQPIGAPAGVTPNPTTGTAALSPQVPPQTVQAPAVGGAPVTLT
jgi:hypothetical protein